MAEVYFNLQQIPRVTTKEEWYKAWRIVRVIKKRVQKANNQKIEALRNKTIPLEIRAAIMDELTNPPLILGPYMELP